MPCFRGNNRRRGLFIGVNFATVDLRRAEPSRIIGRWIILFYCPVDEEAECLLYSSDWGKTAQRHILKRGYVKIVFEQLPD